MDIRYNNLENLIGQYLLKNAPYCIYIHIPFCKRKCYYCDFYSIVPDHDNESLVELYVDALNHEMEQWYSLGLKRIKTLYIGGGTPSILKPNQLKRVFEALHNHFLLEDDVEFTFELNPESIDKEKLKILKDYCVNRLSIGIQSFNDNVLRSVGRLTRFYDIQRAFEAIEFSGFRNINFDLILGIQDERIFKKDLEKVIRFFPAHISIYMLHLDEDTILHKKVKKGEFFSPDDEYFTTLYIFTTEFLNKLGYLHYEISNFALPGFECRHNLNYWQGKDYIGIGSGAVSTIGKYRIKNPENVILYTEKLNNGDSAFVLEEILDDLKKVEEQIMLSLRTSHGISLFHLRSYTGDIVYDKLLRYFEKLESMKLLKREGDRVFLSSSGFLKFNIILSEIFNIIEKDYIQER